jgi:hypothetical protein
LKTRLLIVLIVFIVWVMVGCGTISIQVEVVQPTDATLTRIAVATQTAMGVAAHATINSSVVAMLTQIAATETAWAAIPTKTMTATLTLTTTADYRGTSISATRTTRATLTAATVTAARASCSSRFFFGDLPGYCPTDSAYAANAAFQPYDGGSMLWEGASGGMATYLEQSVYAPWPDATIEATPPPGHVRPVSGFGRVWNNHADIRRGLGWPWAAERGYTTQIQKGRNHSTGGSSTFLTLPSGQVIEFSYGSWRPIT